MKHFAALQEHEQLSMIDINNIHSVKSTIEITSEIRQILINIIAKNVGDKSVLNPTSAFFIDENILDLSEIKFLRNAQLRFEIRHSLLCEFATPFKTDASVLIAKALNDLSDLDLIGFSSFIKPERLN